MSKVNGFIGRRDILKLAGMGSIGIAATAASSVLWGEQQATASQPVTIKENSHANNTHAANPNPVSADAALKRLIEGNQRFVQQKSLHPDQTVARLQLVAKGQHPFAAILGCADSRVPAEILFDEGLGDLFNVRVAGNVASNEAIGSLEYSTAVLGAQLIVVLGHRKCGAVAEAVKGELLPGRISSFVEAIKPALAKVKGTNDANKADSPNLIDDAVVANIQYQVQILKQNSTILAQLVETGKLKIVGARYNLDNGEITLVS